MTVTRNLDYDPTSQQPFELVQLVVDGVPYEGWESIQVTTEMPDLVVTFQLTTSEVRADGQYPDPLVDTFTKWHFPPGTQVDVYATGREFVSGYVNAYLPFATAEQHGVTVVGITRGKDFVESSVKHPTGTFENMTDLAIVQEIGMGLQQPISVFAPPEFVPHWQIRQGATGFQETMRLLQPRQKMIVPRMPDGEPTIISSMPFEVIPEANIIQGVNVLQMSAKLSNNQFDEINVVGQAVDGVDPIQNLRPFGIAYVPAKFSGSPRFRFKKVIDQQSTTMALALKRAMWDAMRAQGANTEVQVTVPGWRHGRGDFWSINTDVYVNCPYLQVDCWLRIQKLVFRQSLSSGTVTDITLVDPQVFGGSVASCNSGPAWGFSLDFAKDALQHIPSNFPTQLFGGR